MDAARKTLAAEACAPFDLPALRDALAKAKQDAEIARGNLAHLRRYLESLLGSPDSNPR